MRDSTERLPDVLVTLADSRFVEAAKQLFSSAYHEGGWRGDYLLLGHGLAERDVGWFRDRGILVRECEPLRESQIGGMPAVLASKFHVFAEDFRRWRTIVYLDADASIRASIDAVVGDGGFRAVLDWNPTLKLQIASRRETAARGVPRAEARALTRAIAATHDLRAPSFCAGFFAFDSRLVDDGVFDEVLEHARRYGDVSRFGDQLVMNLVFAGRWRRLSPVFHLLLWNGTPPWPLPRSRAEALVLHFTGPLKPWTSASAEREAWRRSLERGEAMDVRDVPRGVAWSERKLRAQSRLLSLTERIGSFARRSAALRHRID